MTSNPSPAAPIVTSYEGALGFARAEDVSIDTLRPGGLLRARTHETDAERRVSLAMHRVRLIDDAAPGAAAPRLDREGFEAVELGADARLTTLLAAVAAASHLDEAQAQALRRLLRGRVIPLGDGRRLRVLFVASEGIIFRSSGPNGAVPRPGEPITARNGHQAAAQVHVDQDVRGTPLRQLLFGLAPRLFRHDSPDSANRRSRLHLLNVWIPLQQITMPLALMDERSFDRRRHQLRYALPTDEFFVRDPSLRINDIWSVLPDPEQRWHFRSAMPLGTAYVFNTLSTPHGAFVVPGEAAGGRLAARLRAVADARLRGDAATLAALLREREAVSASLAAEATTPALRAAIVGLDALLDEAAGRDDDDAARAAEFAARVAASCERLVRKSIELRAVVWVSPGPSRR